MGPVVPDHMDVDDVLDGPVDVGPAVDVGIDSFNGHVEVGPTVGVPPNEDDAYDRPIYVGPTLGGGPVEVGPTEEGLLRCTLIHLFEMTYDIGNPRPELERFPPLRGPYTDINVHLHINDPFELDVDAACCTMLTMDLPNLFGIMTRSANMVIRICDSHEFADWLDVYTFYMTFIWVLTLIYGDVRF